MNQKLIVGVIAAVVIVGGVFALTRSGANPTKQLSTESTQNQNGLKDDTAMSKEGSPADIEKDKMMADNSRILGVVLKAGKLYTIWPNNEIMLINHDLVLQNGTKISAAGVITDVNGKTITLKEGEELSTAGQMMMVDLSKMMEAKPEAAGIMKDEKAMDKKDVMMAKTGAYKDYSPETVAAEQKAGNKVVLFFHAVWCPYCKAADAAFKANLDKIPAGVTVLKTDYDSNTALKQKYGVTYQHTFVQIDNAGNQVTKWNGGDTDNLTKFIK